MVVERRVGSPLVEIPFQSGSRGLVHGHEPALAELGPMNHQAVWGDVVIAQPNRFGDRRPVQANNANSVL
jgi:hypothetical protein